MPKASVFLVLITKDFRFFIMIFEVMSFAGFEFGPKPVFWDDVVGRPMGIPPGVPPGSPGLRKVNPGGLLMGSACVRSST